MDEPGFVVDSCDMKKIVTDRGTGFVLETEGFSCSQSYLIRLSNGREIWVYADEIEE